MATVRSRNRRGGIFWFLVDRYGRERKMGPGAAGKAAANRARGRLELAEWAERRGEPVESSGRSNWTLLDLRDQDLEANAGKASVRSRARLWAVLLEGFGEATRLDQLTPAKIQGWATRRARHVSARTVNNGLSLLSAGLKFARRMRHASGFTGTPFAEVSRVPPAPVTLHRVETEVTIRAIFARAWKRALSAPSHLRELWRDDAAIIELTYWTSSRISQVLRLRWDQIGAGVIRFPPHKLGAPREFEITRQIAAVLRKVPRRGEYLFPPSARSSKPYREDLKRFWKAVSEPGFTPHGLRHSSITAALYAGESLPDAANRGGWKDLQMLTRTYGHIFRKRIGGLPRAGVKTAEHSGQRRRAGAG